MFNSEWTERYPYFIIILVTDSKMCLDNPTRNAGWIVGWQLVES